MGIVSGMVNNADQPASEIVREIVVEAEALLRSARHYTGTNAHL